jgi:hypothetical protein
MGLDFSANVHVGFCYDAEKFDKFKITKPEVSHMAIRYDSETGKRIKDVKVIDSNEHEVYSFDNSEHEDMYEFVTAVADKYGCEAVLYGDGCGYYAAVGFFIKDDDYQTKNPAEDFHPLIIGNSIKASFVIDNKKKLDALKNKLTALLPTGEAEIFIAFSAS